MLRRAFSVSVGWLALSMVADGLPALLLPYLMLAEGDADATRLGMVTLAAIGVAALLQPVAGWVSDRAGRLPVIGGGTAAAVAGLGLMLVPGGAVAGTILALSGVSVAQAGQQALLPDRIGVEWRGRAGGLKGAFDVAGAFVGFLVLGAMLGSGDAGLGAGALAAMLVGGAVLTSVLVGPATADVPRTPPGGSPDVALLARLVAARFLFLLGIYAVGRFLLLFIAERLQLGADAAAGEAGGVLALLALVTVVASIPGGWLADRVGRTPVMVAGGTIGAIGIGLLPTAASLGTIIACGTLMAIGSATFGAASWAMLGDLTRSRVSGRLMGLANIGTAGAAASAGLFGSVVDGAGFGAAFGLAAACALGGGVLASSLGMTPRRAEGLIGSTEGAH